MRELRGIYCPQDLEAFKAECDTIQHRQHALATMNRSKTGVFWMPKMPSAVIRGLQGAAVINAQWLRGLLTVDTVLESALANAHAYLSVPTEADEVVQGLTYVRLL
jgi:hypothetical protein